jgi:hypothetical protein
MRRKETEESVEQVPEITVNIPLTAYGSTISGAPKITTALLITTINNHSPFYAQIAPTEVTYANFGNNWTEVPRDGKEPYLVKESKKLPTMSFTMVVANDMDLNLNQQGRLNTLKNLAHAVAPLKISYGGYFESIYRWRCTNFSFKSVRRHPTHHFITWAEVEMEFTLASDVNTSVGPVSTSKSRSQSRYKPLGSKVGKRRHRLKHTDTLASLAKHFYRNTRYWRYLGDLNKIKNPRRSTRLRRGRVIRY